MTLVNCRPELMNLSFSGCGFLCIYHAGVAAAIQQHAPQMLQNKILGASAGSIVACGLITNVCLSNATTTILKVVSQARARTFGPLHPEFDLLGIVRKELEDILPPDAYELCTGRLIISLTRWKDHENVLIEEYTSNQDLIDAIMCSCFIPFYCGINPPKFRGVQYIDGGVSDNQPIYDRNTVTVSPFAGESDICPPDWDSGSLLGVDFNGTSIRFTTRNMLRLMATLWPRSNEEMSKMCLQGFEDALRFLAKLGMSPCIRCLTIQTIDGTGSAARLTSESASEVDEVVKKGIKVGMPKKKRSSLNMVNGRFRGESECDTCGESDLVLDDINVSRVFPSFLKKPFEDAVAAEKSMFDYLLSFRLVRYASTAFGLGKFPMDLTIAFAKRTIDYLELMSPPRWVMLKMRGLADFMVVEIEKQKSRYTNFACFVAVTEVDRYGSALSQSTMEQQEEREIELSEEAQKELKILREKDRKRRMQKKFSRPEPSTSSQSVPDDSYDVDSFDHVVEFTRTHEAMYEFHYLDENNKMRSVGLFADNHNRASSISSHHHHSSSGGCSHAGTPTTSRKLVHVPEEDEESGKVTFHGGVEISEMEKMEEDEEDRNVEENEERDSGLSGIETERTPEVAASTSTSKRDACCSPVREFAEATTIGEASSSKMGSTVSGRGRGSLRRYNTGDAAMRKSSSVSVGKKKTVTVSNPMSSDSEEVDGTEKLFVPSRKAWRASSEYEKEQENASDTTP